MAAFGPKALAQAGRLGLPYLASPVESMATLESNYARHRASAEDAGHGEIDTVPVMRTVFLTSSEKQGRELRESVHRQAQENGRLAADADVDDWTIIGDRHLVSDRVQEYRERLGVSHLIVLVGV